MRDENFFDINKEKSIVYINELEQDVVVFF
jgi:hypothetical protein